MQDITEVSFYSLEDFDLIEKIDAHVHVNSMNPAFIQQSRADNFKLLSINVDTAEFPPIEEQMAISESLLKANPGHFTFVSTFQMHGWDANDWHERTIKYLDKTFSRGAIAVKIWKNIGMEYRDENGKMVMIDDAKFDPIFQYIIQKKVPILGHLGEPKDCWLPLEDISIKYIRDYFQTHPQYHMYLHPEFPSYEDQIAARDRMLDKYPKMVFNGVHLASIEWDIDQLVGFLNRYLNTVIDLAARMMYMQYHSSQNRKMIKDFFIKYQDRILYGTDIIQDPDIDPSQFKDEVHEKWLEDWTYLATEDFMQTDEFDVNFQGLALPRQVLEKIYRINAENLFPNAWMKNDGKNNKLSKQRKL